MGLTGDSHALTPRVASAHGHAYGGMVSDIESQLSDWQAAGLLDGDSAARILAFERAKAAAAPGTPPVIARPERDRPTIIEALVYLGLVVIAAGFIFLVGQNWDQFESWARILICVTPTLATLLLGFALAGSDNAGLRRGGQLAWFVSVALLGTSILVIIHEMSDNSRGDNVRNALMLVSFVTLVYAIALWVAGPHEPQVAAIAGAAFFLVQAIGDWPDEFSTELIGVTGLAFGFLAIALGELGKFTPKMAVRVFFSVFLIVSTYEASFESRWWFETLTFIASFGLLGLGIARNSFALVVAGIAGTFLALVTFVFAHFSDSLGAPIALIISGALVLMAVMLTMQAKAITRTRTRMREGTY